jgi:hypothetical protein
MYVNIFSVFYFTVTEGERGIFCGRGYPKRQSLALCARVSTESGAAESEQGDFRRDAEADRGADRAQAAIDVDQRRRHGGGGG